MIYFTNINFFIFIINCFVNIFNYIIKKNNNLKILIFQILYNFFVLLFLFKKKMMCLEKINFIIFLLCFLV
ncbi:hypothetical protein ONB66_00790 [Candidatus Vidania fulgoroideae]|uniref:Uncharacterized protein n=1 Tax=Candidatus Vidania fulgoroideorum TaxID=881286 RepID=A0AAX3NA43_9PROT|nr:hypothetical protein ONB67_00105 [Candidatus Vidania fulgoroideae]WDR79379.1 hypothetical protein ONB66_00790 [Candidatus Vidania fulgoroideae]